MQKRKYEKKICLNCNEEFNARADEIKRGNGKYCSRDCFNQTLRNGKRAGANHPRWKGGKYITYHGYIKVWSPGHPNADKNGRVLEHRLVIEQNLGRYLLPHEVIHHVDGNKINNHIENLMVFESNIKHKGWHKKQREKNRDLLSA